MKPLQLLALFLFICLTSCTIQKRVHLPGYHVEWNQKKKPHKPLKQSQNLEEESVVLVPVEEPVVISNDSLLHAVKQTPSPQTEVPKTSHFAPQKRTIDPSKLKKERSNEQQEPLFSKPIPNHIKNAVGATVEDEKEYNKTGLLGFIFALGFWLVPFYGPILLLPALICSSVGLFQTKEEPEKYKGETLYLTGIVICALGVLGILTFLIFPSLAEDFAFGIISLLFF